MTKVIVALIDGFEELEAISVIDILRRGEVEVQLMSLSGEVAHGKHGVSMKSDILFEEAKLSSIDTLVIPGGTMDYLEHVEFLKWVQALDQQKRQLCAICAAPTVFGTLGIMKDKRATVYPGLEEYMQGAILENKSVVVDDRYITSRGPATAAEFALVILESIKGKQVCDQIAKDMLFI